MRRSIGPIAALSIATYLCVLPAYSEGLASHGSSVAVFDFFNLSDEATYDGWESLFGRGLRRGLFTHGEIEVVPYPDIHKALSDLQVADYFITPEQIPPIGMKLDADLAVLGSFNVEESVVACSLKVVDARTGKVLGEDIRFGSKDESDTFLGELEKGLEKLLFGESVSTQSPSPAPAAPNAPIPPSTDEVPAEEAPWTPVTQVAPVGAPVGAPIEPAVEPLPSEPQPSVSIQGPGAPSERVGAEEAGARPLTPQSGSGAVEPAQPPAAVPLQNVLDDAWKRSTDSNLPAPGTVSAPQWSSTSLPPPGPSVGVPPQPRQPSGDPFAPMTGQPPAPPVSAPPQQPQPYPQQPYYQTPPRPIEAEIPPLQPPPRMGNIQAPFQPMNVQPAPPSQQVQQYPYVPPSPQSLAPQEQPRPGPISRFFGWIGRAFGGGDDAPPAPTPGAQMVPQQQSQDPNLWIYNNRQSNAAHRLQSSKTDGIESDRVLVASLPPQSFGVGTDAVQGEERFPAPLPLTAGIAPKDKPFEPKGLAGWAKTYFDAGNYDLAEDAYKKAVLEDPKNADLHFNLAQTQLALGKEDAARKSLMRTAEIRPNDRETLDRLGALHAKKGDWGQAIDTYTSLALASPSDAEAFNKLGNAFDRAGRPRDALRAFRKALALDPKNAHAAHHAADVFEKLNRPQDAQAYSQLARSISG